LFADLVLTANSLISTTLMRPRIQIALDRQFRASFPNQVALSTIDATHLWRPMKIGENQETTICGIQHPSKLINLRTCDLFLKKQASESDATFEWKKSNIQSENPRLFKTARIFYQPKVICFLIPCSFIR
jgi:hypothetical protein